MTGTERLGQEHLAEIKVRRQAIESYLPLIETGTGQDPYLDGVQAYSAIRSVQKQQVEAYILDNDALCNFVVNAPRDIDALLAEVQYLHQQLAQERDAARRHANYIASCVDAYGSYQP